MPRSITGCITAVIAVLLAVMALPGNVTTAHAWTDGKAYQEDCPNYCWTWDHTSITYFIDSANVPSWADGTIRQAANNWTYGAYNTPSGGVQQSKLYYIPGGTSTSNADVMVTNYTGNTNYSGIGECAYIIQAYAGAPYHCPNRAGVGYVKMRFPSNSTYTAGTEYGMYANTPQWDLALVGQESGHSIALAHSCVPNVIMSGPNTQFNCGAYSGYCSETSTCTDTPQNDDMDGVISLYGVFTPQPPSCVGIVCAIHQSSTKQDVVQWLESFPPDQIPLNP